MDHFEIVVSEVDEPACLAAVMCLGLAEIGQVLLIGKDLHREGGAVKIVAPGFQGADDCEELSVVDVIISLSRGERLRKIGTWVPVTIEVGLEEDSSGRILRSVGGNGEGGRQVGKVENGLREEKAFEGVEGRLT